MYMKLIALMFLCGCASNVDSRSGEVPYTEFEGSLYEFRRIKDPPAEYNSYIDEMKIEYRKDPYHENFKEISLYQILRKPDGRMLFVFHIVHVNDLNVMFETDAKGKIISKHLYSLTWN